FQAEDGIRDWSVTGVQTCALPISAPSAGGSACTGLPQRGLCLRGVPALGQCRRSRRGAGAGRRARGVAPLRRLRLAGGAGARGRSEERRVGKGGGRRGVEEQGEKE